MRVIYLFILLMMNSLYAGEIVTTDDFSLIENEMIGLDESSLVLFDVDATLIIPDDSILKPKGKELFKRLVAGYKDRDLYREIRVKAPQSLVDKKSLHLIQKLQDNKVPVIAFTGAPSSVKGIEDPGVWRVEELLRYGFDFSQAFPDTDFVEIHSQSLEDPSPLYKSGVLYSCFKPKGEILIEFLKQMELSPGKVIFIDDELNHVQSVVTALEEAGISCVGFHYTAADKFPCRLSMKRALFQIDFFVQYGLWVSDEDCRNLLRG